MKHLKIIGFLFCFVFAFALSGLASPPEQAPQVAAPENPTRVTVAQVQERLAQGGQIVYIDARHGNSWTYADTVIAGSIHVGTSQQLGKLLKTLPMESYIVPYCT